MRAARSDVEAGTWLQRLPFSLNGKHFNTSAVFLSFTAFTLRQFLPPSPFSRQNPNCINTLLSKTLFTFKQQQIQSVLVEKRGSPAVPKFAVRNYSFVAAAENQRCILTHQLLSSLNFAGFLAAAAGSSEDNADLGKQPFSAAYLLSWRRARNHNWWNIIKTNPQNRFMISFSAGSLTFKSLISLCSEQNGR